MLNANEVFEIKAEAFRRMTGHMAPGKDPGLVAAEDPAARSAAWEVWVEAYGDAVIATISAYERVMG